MRSEVKDSDALMSLLIFTFIVSQVAALYGLARLIARRGINAATVFGTTYAVLIVLPFTLIALHENGSIALDRYVGRTIGNNLILEIGSGRRPLLAVALFEVAVIASYMAFSQSVRQRSAKRPWQPSSPRRYLKTALAVNLVLVGYVMVRTIFVPDFPLFALLRGQPGRLRDTAFSFATNASVPYPFLPQVYGVVHQVLLPSAGLMLLASSQASGNRKVHRWAVASLLFAAMLNMGTFKRAQFLFFGAMLFVFYFAKRRPKVRSAMYILAGATFVVGMTAAYSGFTDFDKAAQDALNRTLVTEAIVEYTAINHYGTTFEHLGAELPLTHVAKVMGGDVATFSETWKEQSAGSDSRGFSSVGIVGESWVVGGWAGVGLIGIVLGLGLAIVDRSLIETSSIFRRPYEAALVMTIAFMATKGVMSQLFSGGLIALVLCWALVMSRIRSRRLRSPSRAFHLDPSARPRVAES